ncbi:MAG TPA: hypothetical protein VIS06_11160 [Mycobacteriales bacterium]
MAPSVGMAELRRWDEAVRNEASDTGAGLDQILPSTPVDGPNG